MKELKIAVIGAGFWGKNHIRVFNELSETEVVAVCDTNPERAEAAAQKFGLKSYTDSQKMFKEEKIDAVTLCVWSTNLAGEAMKALEAEKHILVEKPMASSAREAFKIIELADRKKRHLTVGFIERFNPAVQRFKKLINNGEIGSLVSATAKRVSRWPERVGDVGVVKDTAIHDIDIMRYVFAEDPMAVYASAGSLKHARFEDYAQIMLTFSEGRTAFIEANWLTPYKIRKLIATGSKAIISLDYITQEMSIETEGQTLTPREDWKEPLKLELQHFVECILKGEEPLVTGLDGLKALEIAEAALRSATKCRIVKPKGNRT
mgnify:CR=1 FL=1